MCVWRGEGGQGVGERGAKVFVLTAGSGWVDHVLCSC